MLVTLQKNITPLIAPTVTVSLSTNRTNTKIIPSRTYSKIVASQALLHRLQVEEPNTLL